MTDIPQHTSPAERTVEAAIDRKTERLDEIAGPAIASTNARQEAYQRIIDESKRAMTEYYRRYPSRALDERSQDAEMWFLNALRNSFAILDEYAINFRNEAKTHEQQSTDTANSSTPNPVK